MNGGNSIRYDYDALDDLVEKTYRDENRRAKLLLCEMSSEQLRGN